MTKPIDYTVTTFRKAGLQCKWSRIDGRPIIVARDRLNPLSSWTPIDSLMFESMRSGHLGSIKETFIKWQQFATIQPLKEQGI